MKHVLYIRAYISFQNITTNDGLTNGMICGARTNLSVLFLWADDGRAVGREDAYLCLTGLQVAPEG